MMDNKTFLMHEPRKVADLGTTPFTLEAHDKIIQIEALRNAVDRVRKEFKVSQGGSDTIDRVCAAILAGEVKE
jgi:hypothetical protein